MKNLFKNYLSISLFALIVIVVACKKDEVMNPAKSSDKSMSSFAFGSLTPAVSATITGTTVAAMVPFNVDVTSLAPTVTVAAKATVSPASGSTQNFTNAVTYTVTAEDGTTQAYSVTVTKGVAPKSMAKDITKFSFAALSPVVEATIDATSKAITATVPAATDITKLVPTITISDKATVSPASGVATNFSKEVSYTVTAEDASTVVWKVNVKKEEAVISNSFTITEKAKMPLVADLGNRKFIFSINSKVYYLGNSKAKEEDLKYFFEYDPTTNKWIQKADFPFKKNIFGQSNTTYSIFINNNKAVIAGYDYGFFEFDPQTDKWADLGFNTDAALYKTFYDKGSLYSFDPITTYIFDLTTKKLQKIIMSNKIDFSSDPNKTVFKVENKYYFSFSTGGYGTDPTKVSMYEADITNGKYIKRGQDYEIPYIMTNSANSANSNRVNAVFLIEDKVYFLTSGFAYIYDTIKDSYQSVKMPSIYHFSQLSFDSKDYIVVGKTIYWIDKSSFVRTIQIP